MMRKIFLACSAAAFISVASFCHAGNEAGDAYFKGIELASQGNFQEAKQSLSQALSNKSLHSFAQVEIDAINDVLNGKVKKEVAIQAFKGKCYANDKKWDQAISEYYKVIEKCPTFVYAYISRGNAYFATRSYGSAISDFSEAIKLNPSDPELYNNRGVSYQYKGSTDKAIADFSSAIQIDPKSSISYCNRGRAYYVKNKLENALADLDKAIELNPNYIEATLIKGYIYEELNQNENAIAAYREAISLDASNDKQVTKEAEQAIRDIETKINKEIEKKKADDSKKNK